MADHGPEPSVVDAEFPRRMQQVEALVGELEQAPDQRLRERAQELARVLLDLHKAGLAKILAVIRKADGSARLVEELAADDLVANLLLLHDLHPVPLDARVQRAIDDVRTRAARHGGEVVLLENGDGRALVRIAAGSGCGSSNATIREMVEEAIYAEAPDLRELEFDAAEPPAAQTFVSLQQLKSYRPSPSPLPSEPAVAAVDARPR